MQTRNQTIIPLTKLDIHRMVFEAVRRLRVPLDEQNSKWNYETCYEEAKKYKTRGEFMRKSMGAYTAARKNGWLDDYTWFEEIKKQKGYWNYDTCHEEAKKYKTKTEFQRGNSRAYKLARINGWLKDYTWFDEIKKPNGYWNQETCYNEAKKYKSVIEFRKNSNGAYNVALRNKWLDGYDWLEKRAFSDNNNYVVYYYKDEDTNAVYVGLTNSLKRRHKEHCRGFHRHGKVFYDVVYRYFHQLQKEVPEPVILKGDLSAQEAQNYEKHYVEHFKNENLMVLNLAKTGSLGGYGKWTKEKCYDEAKKYKSRSDFKRNSGSAYQAAMRNGWLNDYTWFEKLRDKWNRETCFEEAKKYKSKAEFKRNSSRAYKVALENGWLNDYTWFQKPQMAN